MPDHLSVNDGFLSTLANRETDTLEYAIKALSWFTEYCKNNQAVPWVRTVDGLFLKAVDCLLEYFAQGSTTSAADTVAALSTHLANWRGDFDAAAHPLVHLGQLFLGNPGSQLEHRGPVAAFTMDEVLEGLTIESLSREWDLNDEDSALCLLGLALVVLSSIAETVFLCRNGGGSNLADELSRVFTKKDNRLALRGQLATLILAGQALAWGCHVDFIPEGTAKSPDWSVTNNAAKLFIECTSRTAKAGPTNDHKATEEAIVRAWSEKRHKFSGTHAPGLISIDVSGLFVSREYGTLLKRDPVFLEPVCLCTPCGGTRTIGAYHAAEDTDMMVHESRERLMVGVAANALHSKAAKDADIRGIVIYHGQELVVDMPRKTLSRPQRGVLIWRGRTSDPAFRLALMLSQPALPLPPRSTPPVFAFLV